MATVATKALRHQQLLQPHSFEGFAAAHILDHSRYQPVPQREHPQAEVGEGTVAMALSVSSALGPGVAFSTQQGTDESYVAEDKRD